MIFVDAITEYPQAAVAQKAKRYGGRWCHMWCDGDVAELHNLARKLGLKKCYFQDVKDFPHYDLIESKRKLAVAKGVTEISLRAWIRKKKGLAKRRA
jgi:hypothetical protein